MTTLYNYDAHLSEEDGQLFGHFAKTWRSKSSRAASDLLRDLQGRGYLDEPHHALVDDFEHATVELTFTAGPDGALTVPQGSRVVALDPEYGEVLDDVSSPARIVFVTDAELTVAAGDTGAVSATAEHPGEPWGVGAGWLTALEVEPGNFASVTNSAATSGGVDHQLTRAATYRALESIYTDLMREADDVWDTKRKVYAKKYTGEIDRLISSGLDVDTDGDGIASEEEQDTHEHGYIRLRRG